MILTLQITFCEPYGLVFVPVASMSFWSENYSFIKDVYDTRVSKMIEWMDHVEMAIQKVIPRVIGKVHAGNYGQSIEDIRLSV